MRLKPSWLLLLLLVPDAWAAPADDLQARRDALNALLVEQWDYAMSQVPDFASLTGDRRWNDQLTDLSQAAVDARLAKTSDLVKRFKAVDTTGFPEQEVLNRELIVRFLEDQLEDGRLKNYRMPINQMSGIHLSTAQLPGFLVFKSIKDYDDLITRYRKLPTAFDQTMDQMRAGMAAGLMPPRFLLEKVAGQIEGIAAAPPEQSPFAQPLQKFPQEVPEAEQGRIREAMLAAIRDSVAPAYAKLGKFVREEYALKGRTEPGMWALPDGETRYAWAIKQATTSSLTPEEVHQIGLREVAAVEAQMLEIAKKLGFEDVKSLNASIEANPKLRAQSRQQILDLYTRHIDRMWTKLPELFGRLPKAKVDVGPVEEFREKEASGASYIPGAPDGSRPGRVMVNTGDATSRKLISVESSSYHEGVPGHHMQISIARELPKMPPFRQQGGFGSFAEGWALYSERLGKEVGFYQDPYSDYGRLQDEMLRAIRLVVDTGIHYKRWTREQVVQYFRDHSAIDDVRVQSETDRYMVWPGQALAYKIGQLKILELREKAKKELGPRFDIRRFHDEVLGAGALPLDVLEKRIDNWIAAEKGMHKG